ncbi:heme ABC transporter ATP-binding protein [Natronospirillum operosum]|uniref:Heme ABC transporter ATP-binding protein n=1 Tax=Natronospirillum operosum TaxID=2759953 RepID=A0A4Z0W9F8_9GAMM|nr:heme ABC transporter ATP-binding protein [Natronospirillum operosum]TGG90605.1 heme ABC transporter ATP-binding protein [Natronospirillum operosum]
MLRAQNLTVRIGATTLLADVSCTLRPGELVAVLGCNGAGKSTLLGAVCGDLRFQGGSVHLNERALRDYRMVDLARIRAVMPQSVQLGFPFQAHEVVALGRMPFNEPRARTREAVRQCMALTETAHLQTQVYPTLSGGEKQRVQLARVLSQLWPFAPDQRQYLFLDEATASLDPLHQQQVFSLARQLATRGLGVMAVVHDINLASQFADRVLVLRQGRLLAEGTPQAILTPELIAEAFSGLRVQCTPDALTGQPWVLPLRDQPLPRLGEALAD